MEALTDNSPMPWGKHKDKKMIDVPGPYLMYIYENPKGGGEMSPGPVKTYIEANLEALRIETKKAKEAAEKRKRFKK